MTRRLIEVVSRLAEMFRTTALDRDFDEELATHIDLLSEQNRRRGLPPDEARRQAILKMGGTRATRELHRETRGLPRAADLAQACWQAWRSWRSAKTVALLASLALAVGIGSATAIYTVVDAVMLKPLPYRDGDRFVVLFAGDLNHRDRYSALSYDDARIFQERTRSFDAFGWFREAGKNLTFAGEPHHVQGAAVTLALVDHLGVDPVLGRWFHDQTGAVISSALWRRLGNDPAIIGRPVALDGRIYTVTGVMPPSFHLPVAGITSAGLRTDVWMPLDPGERAGEAYLAYGRRKPGVTFAQAEEDVRRVAAQIAAEDPRGREAYTARLFDLRETAIRDIRPTLLLLFAAAALLFFVACASASGLLLARSVARVRETAMRVSLGARRGQLAVHYFAEGGLISAAGAAGGVLLAFTLTPAIVSIAANHLPLAEEIRVDWTVVSFALGSALLASVLSSLAPLWQAAHMAPADVLGEGVRSSAGVRSRLASQSLVVAEIALAFALLAVSSVLIVHLRNLSRVSPGFDADEVLTFVLSVPGSIARDTQKRIPLQQRLIEAIEAIPGVDSAALANRLPFKGCCADMTIYPEGRPGSPGPPPRTGLMAVDPGYFSTMRIPLRSGRVLTEHDFRSDLRLIVINEVAANRYWGGQDPIGAYARLNTPTGRRVQVVGVVGDVRNDGLSNPTVSEVYMLASHFAIESMSFVVRSKRPAASLMSDVRRVVRGIDPEQPIHEIATMGEIIQETLTLERAASFMTTFFASAALLMAMLGVYGVVSYSVRQRTSEIGLRMALGATRRGVLSLVIGGGLRMAVYGVIPGVIVAIVGAFYLTRLFEIGTIGPAPFVYSTAIVAAVTFAASFVPAWRAALVSPMVAIRNKA